MEAVSFIFRNQNDEDFNDYVEKANTVWEKAFNNTYEYGTCPSHWVIVGFNSEDEVVCAAIFNTNLNGIYYDDEYSKLDIKQDQCFISCVGAYPKNIGNGSKLMIAFIDFIKEKNITCVYLNIDKDENENKLVEFYNKFGFTNDSMYGRILKTERQRCLYIK